jgi:hypothetical protein
MLQSIVAGLRPMQPLEPEAQTDVDRIFSHQHD